MPYWRLQRHRQRDYLAAYLADGRPVYALGLAFDSKTRQLVDADAVELRGSSVQAVSG